MSKLGILVATLVSALCIAFLGGLALSVLLHAIDRGTFGFSWHLPIIFAVGAGIAFIVYFGQIFLSRDRQKP